MSFSSDDSMTVEQKAIRANLLAWIEDLETTDAKQGYGLLRAHSDDSYCCLGRACAVLGAEWEPRDEKGRAQGSDIRGVVVNGAHDDGYMPAVFARQLGLKDGEVARCVVWNDNEKLTFREIAVRLRSEILPRYDTAQLENSHASPLSGDSE